MGAQLSSVAATWREKVCRLGTACAYPNTQRRLFAKESMGWLPRETNAPYGLAKKMMLVQSQSYRQQYGFNSIFLLPANLYGPGDNFDPETSHVIPALILKCIEARESGAEFVEAWGTGRASREFLYVADCADGVLRARQLQRSEPVNLGTGSEITISELLQLIGRLTRFEEFVWQLDKPDGNLDPTRRSRAFRIRIPAQMPLEECLRRTIYCMMKHGALNCHPGFQGAYY